MRERAIWIKVMPAKLALAETKIVNRCANARVNPLIDINLGTLLWCGFGNCVIFGPVEQKLFSTLMVIS